MTHSTGRAGRRFAALALAGALAVAGLWLAVGAGAQGGTSVRDAAYPVGYHTRIDNVRFGKLASTHSHKVRFKFHSTYNGSRITPGSYYHHRCKLDGKPYKKCESPKRYKGLGRGKHTFRVKLIGKTPGYPASDLSDPATYRWKVK